MNSFVPSFRGEEEVQRLFVETFRSQIASLSSGRARYHIPATKPVYERHSGMVYHFKPEMFFQLGGETDFIFPDEKFTIKAGEMCVMPRGVPHGESVRATQTPFENVVVCFYNDTVAIHVAREVSPKKPGVNEIFFYTTDFYTNLVTFMDAIGNLRHYAHAVSATAIKGLLLAELSLLLALVEERVPTQYSDANRVFRCQWLIRNNLDDPTLSVESLAAELRCSPRHLSKIFHHDTGERIVEQISRLRLRNAVDALEKTQLSVKEIAIACGYSNANYFSRVFRSTSGKSPQEYREDLKRIACVVEKQPKAVFYEREEYGFGLTPEVVANAKVKLPE